MSLSIEIKNKFCSSHCNWNKILFADRPVFTKECFDSGKPDAKVKTVDIVVVVLV